MESGGMEIYLRSCVGHDMTCEQGHVVLDNGADIWTGCCDTDNCNVFDPRDVLSIETTTTTDLPTTTTKLETTTTELADTTTDVGDGLRCVRCTNLIGPMGEIGDANQ